MAAFTVSASATPSFSLTGSTTGTWTVSGGPNSSLSAFSAMFFPTLSVANDGSGTGNYTLTSTACTGGSSAGALLSLSGSGSNESITLWGASTSLPGDTTGCNALITLTGAFTGSNGTFLYAGLTGVSEDANLLNDLGLSTGFTSSLKPASSFNSIGSSGTGPITYTTNSEILALNFTPTPEPYSFGLEGLGIAVISLTLRRKRSREQGPVSGRTDC